MKWCAPVLLLAACAAPASRSGEWPGLPEGTLIAPAETEVPEARSGEGHAGAKSHEWHKNHVNLFLGGTINRGGNNFSIAADYERRFSERWGATVFFDYVGARTTTGVVGVGAVYHPTERIALVLGPGFEITSHGGPEWMIRFGGYYMFQAGELIISPTLYLDLVEGGRLVTVAGMSFGWVF